MSRQPELFYDQLAANYRLLFEDWEISTGRQANALGPLLEGECGASKLRLLDCACGVGTQVLGLAKRDHRITACDLSSVAVQRARIEASTPASIVTALTDRRTYFGARRAPLRFRLQIVQLSHDR